MKTVWSKGLNKEESERVREIFTHSAFLRQRLTAILQDKIETNRKLLRSKDNYESPAWAQLQADGIGYERAISEIISLIL